MTDDKDKSPKERLAELFGVPYESGAQPAMGEMDIGTINTTSVYATDEDLTWLAEQTSGGSTLYADTVELDTNRGTFVFDTDGDSVTVDFEPEENDSRQGDTDA